MRCSLRSLRPCGRVGSLPAYPRPIPLIACPDVFCERGYFLSLPFWRRNLYRLSGALARESLPARGLLPHCSSEPVWLSDRLVFLGSIVRRDRAAPSLLGYIVRGGRVEKDLISDDSALAYKSEQGLIVFIGCGHAGSRTSSSGPRRCVVTSGSTPSSAACT